MLQVLNEMIVGDLGDPHGTHRKCLETILKVEDEEYSKSKSNSSYKSIFPPREKIFFYKGAWEEWDLAMCRVIVPMYPS
jgi:glucosamine-6-phosphate deaminase